jgi:hypothetical protein
VDGPINKPVPQLDDAFHHLAGGTKACLVPATPFLSSFDVATTVVARDQSELQ